MSHKPDCRCAHQTLNALIASVILSYGLIIAGAWLVASR